MSFKSIFGITPQKIRPTADGGLATKMINGTGAPTVKGQVVTQSSLADNTAVVVPIDTADAIGVFLFDGDPAGADTWVVFTGKAYAYFITGTTAGHLARTMLTADTAATPTDGVALSEAYPVAPFASDKHFCEIGHVLQSRTGAGLALVNLHFN